MASMSMGFPLEPVNDLASRSPRSASMRRRDRGSSCGVTGSALSPTNPTRLSAELAEVAELKASLERALEALAAEKDSMRALSAASNDLVELNVGGAYHTVKRATLCQVEGSLLASMFSGRWEASLDRDKENRVFLDFEPELFQLVLNHLRHIRLVPAARFDLTVVELARKPAFRDLVDFLGLREVFYRLHCEHAEHGQNATVSCDRCKVNSFKPLQTVFADKPLCAVCMGNNNSNKGFQSRGIKCQTCKAPVQTVANVDMAFTRVVCDKCHANTCD